MRSPSNVGTEAANQALPPPDPDMVRWANRITDAIDRVEAASSRLGDLGDELFGVLTLPAPATGTLMGHDAPVGHVALIDKEIITLHAALGLLEERLDRLGRLT